ncbi:hypothetical protein MmiAt1_02450 [Methanimicrococcus sp. At1]|uniref:DUF3307 domain-containing protein n=1 Tax=Methanimicrococcus hacksteinii TaxID=3028293 RepID=A0ABU3VMS5_9EURY|nr:DUF3307 domain-containing protein [Methanimicrococcus sp. At1]MDV0444709.1 hypothetical protein [Methanimicrococcus sp. At1]
MPESVFSAFSAFSAFSFYLILLLLCHFIGDYYLQTNKMAQMKESNIQYTILHSILYAVPFAVLLLGLMFLKLFSLPAAGIIIAAVILHAVVDLSKCVFEKSKSAEFENSAHFKRNIYAADQILHLFVIVIASFLLSEITVSNLIVSNLAVSNMTASNTAVFDGISPELYVFLKYLLFIIIIAKPINISFKKIFEKYQPTQTTDKNCVDPDSVSGAGATIGTLERLLAGIFIGIGQFAAIGLVLTAKSIVRYDQISKCKPFAEYFLIGTLYSILATLIVYYVIFDFLA